MEPLQALRGYKNKAKEVEKENNETDTVNRMESNDSSRTFTTYDQLGSPTK